MSTITIRPGTAADLKAVHQLVGELAEYENAAHSFTASLEDYQQDFATNIFETIVAEDQGQIIGMTLFYMSYSTWKGRMLYLEDFVVAEAYRRKGVGKLLFHAYMERARELNCRLVKWQVLDWNEPAINFYEENGAIIERDWWNGKIFL